MLQVCTYRIWPIYVIALKGQFHCLVTSNEYYCCLLFLLWYYWQFILKMLRMNFVLILVITVCVFINMLFFLLTLFSPCSIFHVLILNLIIVGAGVIMACFYPNIGGIIRYCLYPFSALAFIFRLFLLSLLLSSSSS